MAANLAALRASAYPYRRGLDWLRSIADEHTALADVIVEREITAVDSDEALADFERGRMGRVRSSRLGKRRNRPRA